LVKDTTNTSLKTEIEKLEAKLTVTQRTVTESRTEYVETVSEESSVNKMVEFYSS
jgi:hypothetical protein